MVLPIKRKNPWRFAKGSSSPVAEAGSGALDGTSEMALLMCRPVATRPLWLLTGFFQPEVFLRGVDIGKGPELRVECGYLCWTKLPHAHQRHEGNDAPVRLALKQLLQRRQAPFPVQCVERLETFPCGRDHEIRPGGD